MARKTNKSGRSVEDITDAEISAIIRYLDPDSRSDDSASPDNSVSAIYLNVIFFIRGLGRLHVPFPPSH